MKKENPNLGKLAILAFANLFLLLGKLVVAGLISGGLFALVSLGFFGVYGLVSPVVEEYGMMHSALSVGAFFGSLVFLLNLGYLLFGTGKKKG